MTIGARALSPEVLADDDGIRTFGCTLEKRHQAPAVDRLRELLREPRSREVRDRGREIDERHRLAHATRGEAARRMDHERDTGRVLAEGHLEEQPVLAEEVAVIGGEHHDRVLRQAAGSERGQDLADSLIDVREAGVVAVAGAANVVLRDPGLSERTVLP